MVGQTGKSVILDQGLDKVPVRRVGWNDDPDTIVELLRRRYSSIGCPWQLIVSLQRSERRGRFDQFGSERPLLIRSRDQEERNEGSELSRRSFAISGGQMTKERGKTNDGSTDPLIPLRSRSPQHLALPTPLNPIEIRRDGRSAGARGLFAISIGRVRERSESI